ncbi:MAG: A24 family peptidase [Rickettsiales bacterium]|nr:A24 family peptidase [Rickettsiales bacterium]
MTFIYVFSIILALAIAWRDGASRIIPDALLWPLALGGIFAFGGNSGHAAAAAAGYGLGFALMRLGIKKEALGFGDVKLLAVAGLWLGIDGLSAAVIFACGIGIAWGLAAKQKSVPFAPFLCAGAAAYYILRHLAVF